ncbi:MAG: DUF748 domain-containing protein [Halioglobus sp.]
MIRFAIKAYLIYLAIALLLVLPALNFLLPAYVQKNFQRDLNTEIILFNPFTLSLIIRDASLPERNGNPFTGFSFGEVNLSLESIWSPGWVFDAVEFEDFYVDVYLLEDQSFNFSDLLESSEPAEPAQQSADSAALPGLTVRDFHFHSKWIRFTDQSRLKPFSTHYNGLEIAVRDLSTIIEEGKPYSFEAKDEAGGILRWEGHLSVPGAHSDGILSLSNISLAPLSRFIEPWVKFELTQGVLDVAGRYRVNWADAVSYHVDQASLTLTETRVTPQDVETLIDTHVSLEEFHISGVTVDGPSEKVDIESVALTAAKITGWSEGSQVSLADMFVPQDSTEPAQESTPSAWSFTVSSTTVLDSEIHWRSEFTEPSITRVTPISASVSGVQWPLTGEAKAGLSLVINDKASLNLDAIVALDSGTGSVQYALGELPLAWFNPNLPKSISAIVDSGLVGLTGAVELEKFSPVKISSDGAVNDFSVSIEENEKAITSWDSLRWKTLGVDLQQREVILEQLLVDSYSGRLHIHSDGTINAQRALMSETAPAAQEVAQEAVQEPIESNSDDEPWSFSIPAISITDSALDFMDESLPISFRTVIGDLNGSINGLGSKTSDEASVDLTGAVDGYAPVKLSGKAKPFAGAPALDLALTFDGVDLARLTPYSGTYAGHAIDRGVLNLDLKYRLNDSRLVGDNQVIIEQLKLGEKVESDKAVDLPLSLAIALLTDANGVIDLAVPVSGNIDDPQFGLGSVIFSALVNIITKAVTAPFSLLANLIGSEEDLQRVTFPFGTAALDEAGKAKLKELTSALVQRPELVLVIAGQLNPEADQRELQNKRLMSESIEDGLTQEQWDSKGPQWQKAIGKKYNKLGREETDSPVSIADQFKAVAASLTVEPAQLKKLAEERALAVKRFLVNEAQLPAERSVIEKFNLIDEANTFSGTELKIDS